MTYPSSFFALLVGVGFLLGVISGILGNFIVFGVAS